MNGKKMEVDGIELQVRQFKASHDRGGNVSSAHSTTALFSKKFNNLFVKNFPKPNFSEEDLKVSQPESSTFRPEMILIFARFLTESV